MLKNKKNSILALTKVDIEFSIFKIFKKKITILDDEEGKGLGKDGENLLLFWK